MVRGIFTGIKDVHRRLIEILYSVLEPELLILDEPTVGVDPLLRKSIWDHLVNIASTGNKTIIITTHYIEETRQAHVVRLLFFFFLLFS